ncbi:hypothetical protein, partial [Ferrimicrobium acidiphilum]|uniref:hypothetical protein n=1 Tax=Ferrimicrobium acidiphilum TaxID=121039 RepID=UPI0023F07986
MKLIKDRHIDDVAEQVGLDPIAVRGDGLSIGIDNEGRDVKAPFGVIVAAIHGALLAKQLLEIQEHDRAVLNADKEHLESLIADARSKGSKVSTLKQKLSSEDAHELHVFLEASANALKSAKVLGSNSQSDLNEFLQGFVGMDATADIDALIGAIVSQIARTPHDYISVRGDLGTMTHKILEVQLRNIKETGVWAYDPAVTARDVPNANPRCVAAAQLTISRLQSDLGCVPSDIIGLEVTAVMSTTGSVGTADLALRINNKAVVVDWKTQRTLNEGIAWQLASYATADYWITETDVLQIERPPRVDYEAELLKLMAQTVSATTAEELFAIQNSLSECLSAQAEPKAPARVILPSGEALEIAETA